MCTFHADVGIRCPECAPHRPRISGKGVPLLGGGVATVIGIVIVGSLLGGVLNRGSSGDHPRGVPDYPEEVTVTQLTDPWKPGSTGEQPSAGRRFVALEVTIENPSDSGKPTSVGSYGFKLTDSGNFAYSPTASQAGPALPSELELAPGEKTRGSIMFEVDAANEISSLTYYTVDVALPR